LETETTANLEALLDGFDPVASDKDRRILFEVTAQRLYKDEFLDDDSSDDDGVTLISRSSARRILDEKGNGDNQVAPDNTPFLVNT